MLPQGQDFFSLGELLLLAVVAGNALTALAAAAALTRGSAAAGTSRPGQDPDVARRMRAARAVLILRRLAIADASYFLLVLATTTGAAAPIATPRLGDAVCHAHRCIAVVSVDRAAARNSRETSVVLTLRLSNSSRYTSHDPWPRRVFVVDDHEERYALDAAEPPLTVPLDAGEILTTARRFTLPATARPAGFFVEQTDGPAYPPGLRCLIVGGACWHAPPPHPAIVLE